MEEGLASEEEFDEIDAEVDREIVAATEFADSNPFPQPDSFHHRVYEEGVAL